MFAIVVGCSVFISIGIVMIWYRLYEVAKQLEIIEGLLNAEAEAQ